VPPAVAALIERALARNPLARMPDMNTIVRELATVASAGPAAAPALQNDATVRETPRPEEASAETLSTRREVRPPSPADRRPPGTAKDGGRATRIAGVVVLLIALCGAAITLVIVQASPAPADGRAPGSAPPPTPSTIPANPSPQVRRPPGRLRDLTPAALRERILAEGWEVLAQRTDTRADFPWSLSLTIVKSSTNGGVTLIRYTKDGMAEPLARRYRDEVEGAAAVSDGRSILIVTVLHDTEGARQLAAALSRP
jgi:hypothetical protein